MKVGDRVLISPDLTMRDGWQPATVIEVENNSFIGTVISARMDDSSIYFGRQSLFKLDKEEICTP